MATIRVVFENGEPERLIEFDPADAPFQHDGRPDPILDVLLGRGVHTPAAQLRLYHVPSRRQAGFQGAFPGFRTGEDLLDRAPTSRLGSQAAVEDPAAEIAAVVSRYTIDQVSACDHAVL